MTENQNSKRRGNYKTYRFKGTAVLVVNELDANDFTFDVTINALSRDNARKRLDGVVLGRKPEWPYESLVYDFDIKGEEASND